METESVGCHCLQGPSWRWSEHEKGRRLSVATEAQTPSAHSMEETAELLDFQS